MEIKSTMTGRRDIYRDYYYYISSVSDRISRTVFAGYLTKSISISIYMYVMCRSSCENAHTLLSFTAT